MDIDIIDRLSKDLKRRVEALESGHGQPKQLVANIDLGEQFNAHLEQVKQTMTEATEALKRLDGVAARLDQLGADVAALAHRLDGVDRAAAAISSDRRDVDRAEPRQQTGQQQGPSEQQQQRMGAGGE